MKVVCYMHFWYAISTSFLVHVYEKFQAFVQYVSGGICVSYSFGAASMIYFAVDAFNSCCLLVCYSVYTLYLLNPAMITLFEMKPCVVLTDEAMILCGFVCRNEGCSVVMRNVNFCSVLGFMKHSENLILVPNKVCFCARISLCVVRNASLYFEFGKKHYKFYLAFCS